MALPNRPPTPGVTGRLPFAEGTKLKVDADGVKEVPKQGSDFDKLSTTAKALVLATGWRPGQPLPSSQQLLEKLSASTTVTVDTRQQTVPQPSQLPNQPLTKEQRLQQDLQTFIEAGQHSNPVYVPNPEQSLVDKYLQNAQASVTTNIYESPLPPVEPKVEPEDEPEVEPHVETTVPENAEESSTVQKTPDRNDAVKYLRTVLSGGRLPFRRKFTYYGGQVEIVLQLTKYFRAGNHLLDIEQSLQSYTVSGKEIKVNLNDRTTDPSIYLTLIQAHKEFEQIVSALIESANNQSFWTVIVQSVYSTGSTKRESSM